MKALLNLKLNTYYLKTSNLTWGFFYVFQAYQFKMDVYGNFLELPCLIKVEMILCLILHVITCISILWYTKQNNLCNY